MRQIVKISQNGQNMEPLPGEGIFIKFQLFKDTDKKRL